MVNSDPHIELTIPTLRLSPKPMADNIVSVFYIESMVY